MALILALLVPLVAGAGLALAGERARSAPRIAGLASALTLLAATLAAIQRERVTFTWVPGLSIDLGFGIDGISAPLVGLTAGVSFLAVILSVGHRPTGGSDGTYFGALLVTAGGALAAFTTTDAIVFFLAFEIVLLPMWVLISRYGDPHDLAARRSAGWGFVLYTAVGSILMLLGILVLVGATGTSDLGALRDAAPQLSRSQQTLAAALLVAGLGVKIPIVGLHSWLPPAHTIAPTAGSMLLAAVLLKLGTYGLVRLPLSLVPVGFAVLAPVLAVIGAVGILWGALVCLVERDLKRLIAYSSVAHMGFVVLALAAGSQTGLQAALFANIAHGVVSALLFATVGSIKDRWGDTDLGVARPALRETAPTLGFFLLTGLAGALALPGLAGFWGEFFTVYAAWSPATGRPLTVMRVTAAVAAVGAALAAAYSLRVARQVWVGDAAEPDQALPTLSRIERGVIGLLALSVLVLGVLPWLVLEVTAPAVAPLVGGR